MAAAFFFSREPLSRARVYSQRRNPLEELDEEKFRKLYRLTKNVTRELTEELKQHGLESGSYSSTALSCEEQVLICLRLLSSGSFQNVIASDAGVNQPCVSRVLSKFLDAILRIAPKYIKMPTTSREIVMAKQQFRAMRGFPGVIGAIDGTLIPVERPYANEHLYVSRKGYHAINVQAVADSNLVFMDIVAKYPGGIHDSFILRRSGLYANMQEKEYDGWLLGDSGYPLLSWLMTPIQESTVTTEGQRQYNIIHKSTRAVVERAFGVLKRRWRVIDHSGGKLCYQPDKTAKIVIACVVLHNICRLKNIELDDDEDDVDIILDQVEEGDRQNDHARGIAQRNILVDFFS